MTAYTYSTQIHSENYGHSCRHRRIWCMYGKQTYYQSLEYSQNAEFQDIMNSINCKTLLEFTVT